jgi:ribosomal-protein-alanine N-acetyltransferase
MRKNNILIEEMSLNHLDSISSILKNSFDDFWNYDILKSEILSDNSKYIVAILNEEIIGFAGIKIIFDTADIMNIVIKKSFRGKGFGKLLFNNLLALCKDNNLSTINLEVSSSNNTAINLYKSFGFSSIDIRKNYYKNSDAIIMQLKLI